MVTIFVINFFPVGQVCTSVHGKNILSLNMGFLSFFIKTMKSSRS